MEIDPPPPPTTSLVFQCFLNTPLQDSRTIEDVPGVGPATKAKLADANIDSSVKLVGHFMLLGRDKNLMKTWLMDVCNVRSQEADKIIGALEEKTKKILTL